MTTPRALLVEDSILFARAILRYLREIGYAVELYRGAIGARSACNGNTFDLYVIDVTIQDNEAGGTANGLDLVRWIQQVHPDANVIVCSSDAASETAAIALGCRFVVKDRDLENGIKKAADRRRQAAPTQC
jgi:ActR/RegA family two-component response regulator